MFTKKTLGGQLPEDLILKINENYFDLFETNEELTSLQMIEKLVNKALTSEISNDFKNLIGGLYSVLLENTKAKNIREFYNSFTNKELIKPIDTENDTENVINLLRNAYIVRMLKGRYQPQITNRETIYSALKIN